MKKSRRAKRIQPKKPARRDRVERCAPQIRFDFRIPRFAYAQQVL
jgi:hypothetical protein